MSREFSRRRLLGAGATIGVGSIAGCTTPSTDGEAAPEATGSNASDSDTGQDDSGDRTEGSPQRGTVGVLPQRYVVTKEAGEIRAYDGTTLEVAFEGAAGEDDGRVLQSVFDAVDGGEVYIRRAEYRPDRRLEVRSSYTRIRSDFARLTFQDHPTDSSAQVDFLIAPGAGSDPTPTRHVEIDGLVLDANKDARSQPTRTADVWNLVSHLAFRNCLIFGGKSVDGDGGYGIGEDDDADYVTVDNCVIRDSDRHAYHPSAAHHRIVNSTFLNNAKETGDVFDLAGTDAVVANNHFENNGHGVKLDDNSDGKRGHVVITGNVFVDNYLEDIASGQIELTEATTRSIQITDNAFVLPQIDAGETSAHVLVDTDERVGSLHVRNNHFEGGGPSALMSFTETGRKIGTLVVEHNTLESIPNDVGLLASADRMLVRDNLFQCDGSGGRLELKAATSGVVSGNVSYGASISVTDGSDLVLERNHEL